MQEPKDQAVDSKADAQPVQPVQQSPEEEAEVRHNLALVEAALYVAGRPLDLNEL